MGVGACRDGQTGMVIAAQPGRAAPSRRIAKVTYCASEEFATEFAKNRRTPKCPAGIVKAVSSSRVAPTSRMACSAWLNQVAKGGFVSSQRVISRSGSPCGTPSWSHWFCQDPRTSADRVG